MLLVTMRIISLYVIYDMGIVTLDLRKTIAVILLTSSDVGWVIHSVFDIGKIFIQ